MLLEASGLVYAKGRDVHVADKDGLVRFAFE